MTERLLIISRDSVDGRPPLDGDPGIRLAKLASTTLDDLRARHEIVSLWPHPLADERPWKPSPKELRSLAAYTCGFYCERRAILLGRDVAKAFGLPRSPLSLDATWFTWTDVDGLLVAPVPHPSGANRWYNDKHNRMQAEAFLKGWLI